MKWVVDQKEYVRVGKLGWERFADKDGRIFYRKSFTALLTLALLFFLPVRMLACTACLRRFRVSLLDQL